jgi:hypothetical protein
MCNAIRASGFFQQKGFDPLAVLKESRTSGGVDPLCVGDLVNPSRVRILKEPK